MADDPNEEFVYVRLAGQGDDVVPGRVSRAAYESIWKGKGWNLVDTEAAEMAGSPATMAEMTAGEPTRAATTKKGA